MGYDHVEYELVDTINLAWVKAFKEVMIVKLITHIDLAICESVVSNPNVCKYGLSTRIASQILSLPCIYFSLK